MNRRLMTIFRVIMEYESAVAINAVVCMLRRIWYLGKHLGCKYRFRFVKTLIHRLALPSFVLYRLVVGAISMGFAAVFAILILSPFVSLLGLQGKGPLTVVFDTGFLYWMYGWTSVMGCRVLGALNDMGDMKRWFWIPPAALGEIYGVWMTPFYAMGRLLPILLIQWILHVGSPLWALFWVLGLALCEWALSGLHLTVRKRTGKWLYRRLPVRLVTIPLYLGLGVLFAKGLVPGSAGLILSLVMLLPAIFGIRAIKSFDGYAELIEESRRAVEEMREKSKQRVAYNVEEKLVPEAVSLKTSGKRGYALLNSLFFLRHRKLLFGGPIIKLAILGAVGLVFNVWALLFPVYRAEMANVMYNLGSFLPFIIYLFCNDENLTRMMFLNCDRCLMRYGFYRRPKVVLRMFRQRLPRVFAVMLIPTSAILATYLAAGWILQGSVLFYWKHLLITVLLTAFFAIYPLFVYYVLQPYDIEAKVKSAPVSLMNMGVYLLCFIWMNQKISIDWYLPILAGAVLAFLLIAVVCIYRFAPRNFRLTRG